MTANRAAAASTAQASAEVEAMNFLRLRGTLHGLLHDLSLLLVRGRGSSDAKSQHGDGEGDNVELHCECLVWQLDENNRIVGFGK